MLRVGSLKLVAEPGSLTPLAALPPERRPDRPRRSASSASSAGASYELDLRGMTGDEAEQTVIAALDAAVLAEQPFLRIIHGKGTGVVRERVQQVLQARPPGEEPRLRPVQSGRQRGHRCGVRRMSMIPDEIDRAGARQRRPALDHRGIGGSQANRLRLPRSLSLPRRPAPELRGYPEEGRATTASCARSPVTCFPGT